MVLSVEKVFDRTASTRGKDLGALWHEDPEERGWQWVVIYGYARNQSPKKKFWKNYERNKEQCWMQGSGADGRYLCRKIPNYMKIKDWNSNRQKFWCHGELWWRHYFIYIYIKTLRKSIKDKSCIKTVGGKHKWHALLKVCSQTGTALMLLLINRASG